MYISPRPERYKIYLGDIRVMLYLLKTKKINVLYKITLVSYILFFFLILIMK